MASQGIVRMWQEDEGWGVVDLPDTPGGCWAHFSDIDTDGYRMLQAGQAVDVEWEAGQQDGFDYRATRIRPLGTAPRVKDPLGSDSSGDSPAALSSSLDVTFSERVVYISALTSTHWPQVRDIYAAGIATGHATFETEPPTWERFDCTRLPDQRRVAVSEEDEVLGWVAASAVSDRCAYAGVVQHAVYVAPTAARSGIGRLLLDALIGSTEASGVWTIQSGIFPENAASLALHEAAGFRVVGVRERIGMMAYGPLAGQWRDVIAVERRSPLIG